LQRLLWEQPACSVEKKIPGKLNLCKGLPVMLRNNSATELCMTNGQEGTVYDWIASVGAFRQPVLEVLFVKLTNPPTDVNFKDLPTNVVPIMRTATPTWCDLPSGKRLHVSRSQVEITVNYAMTDFASQGKTRINNVVHLNDTTTHQGYYTALSRSASAAGTLILQGFNATLISDRKCSGALRQEFRDLELLDDITRLQFESKLPSAVVGDTRRTLIQSFRKHKSDSYIPHHMHAAIRWNKKQPYTEPDFNDMDWSVIPNQQVNRFLPTDYVHGMNEKAEKWKNPSSSDTNGDATSIDQFIPVGCEWNDNSCAYDTVITLLYNMWLDRPSSLTEFLEMSDPLFVTLIKSFQNVQYNQARLTDLREYMCQCLQIQHPDEFEYGRYASITSLLNVLFTAKDNVVNLQYECCAGHLGT
ncbi:hypothetical protein BDN71DRAFT_1401316, partial [Pleurotus eryngii]